MGWLGYTEQETLDTRLQLLEIAHKGCMNKILAMQGMVPETQAAPVEPMPAEAVMGQMRSIFGGKPGKPPQ